MNTTKDHIDLFDKYINDELNSGEVKELEERLLADSDLNGEFTRYKNSLEAINLFAIRQEMHTIMDKGRSRTTYKYWYWSAAAILVFIAVPLFLIFSNKDQSPKEIFYAYYAPFPADQNVRGTNATSEAMKLYNEGKYKEAITQFQKLPVEDESNRRNLLLGNCYLNTGDPAKAIYHFKIGTKSTNSVVRQHSEWYLALSHLYSSDVTKSRELLTSIADSNHLYSNRAKSLIAEFD